MNHDCVISTNLKKKTVNKEGFVRQGGKRGERRKGKRKGRKKERKSGEEGCVPIRVFWSFSCNGREQ